MDSQGSIRRQARTSWALRRAFRMWHFAVLVCATSPWFIFHPAALADTRLPTAAERLVMQTEGFLNGHPDLRYRQRGQREMDAGRLSEALTNFMRASRYADKVSQATVAEMLWTGFGVERDRPLAYAWMDLAAERGYEGFTIHRERYWARLDADERKRAVDLGEALYNEYGDVVARPRLASFMRRKLHMTMGGRPSVVGRSGSVSARIDNDDMQTFHFHDYYALRLWNESRYTEIQDAQWERISRVDVGDVERVRPQGANSD